MTKQFTFTTLDIPSLHRHAIGFDRMFDELSRTFANSRNNESYPPYNIIRTDDSRYTIEVAVAGFAENEIDVEVKDGVLTVRGEHLTNSDTPTDYIHKGISSKSFARMFNLADYVEVTAASVLHGILRIDLEQIIPEEKKARKIAITTK